MYFSIIIGLLGKLKEPKPFDERKLDIIFIFLIISILAFAATFLIDIFLNNGELLLIIFFIIGAISFVVVGHLIFEFWGGLIAVIILPFLFGIYIHYIDYFKTLRVAKMFDTEHVETRLKAIHLTTAGSLYGLKFLCRALKDPDSKVRLAAVHSISKTSYFFEKIVALKEAIKDSNKEVHEVALAEYRKHSGCLEIEEWTQEISRLKNRKKRKRFTSLTILTPISEISNENNIFSDVEETFHRVSSLSICSLCGINPGTKIKRNTWMFSYESASHVQNYDFEFPIRLCKLCENLDNLKEECIKVKIPKSQSIPGHLYVKFSFFNDKVALQFFNINRFLVK